MRVAQNARYVIMNPGGTRGNAELITVEESLNQTDWKALNTVYAKAVQKAYADPAFRAKLF